MESVYIDEKGKYFTNVIRKEVYFATIQTTTHRIQGYIHVRKNERVQDELNRKDPFLAVTDAVLFDHSGNQILTCDFVSINRNQIVWLSPEDGQAQDQSQVENE